MQATQKISKMEFNWSSEYYYRKWNPEYYLEQYHETICWINKYVSLKHVDILDVGCGFYGIVPIFLKISSAKNIYAIDIETRLCLDGELEDGRVWRDRKIKCYKEFIEKSHISPDLFWKAQKEVKFLRMNMDNMGFKKDIFDFIYAWVSVQYSKDIRRALLEMKRVLRPKGYIFIKHHFYYSYERYKSTINIKERNLRRPWEHLLHKDNDISTIDNKIKKSELEGLFSGVGLKIIEAKIVDSRKIPDDLYALICNKYGFISREDLEIGNMKYVLQKAR